ncbi:hypothetical protein Droror1_Dr00018064 [Drosera rotundifolia]
MWRRRVSGLFLPAGFFDPIVSTPSLALPAPAERNGSGILVKLMSRYDSHVGDPISYHDRLPTIFKVFQVHDGKDIATRRIEAIQEGKLAFLLLAAFLKEANGFEHQEAVMPTVPSLDMLLSIEDVMEKSSLEYHLSRNMFVGSELVNMYARCGQMGNTHRVADCAVGDRVGFEELGLVFEVQDRDDVGLIECK